MLNRSEQSIDVSGLHGVHSDSARKDWCGDLLFAGSVACPWHDTSAPGLNGTRKPPPKPAFRVTLPYPFGGTTGTLTAPSPFATMGSRSPLTPRKFRVYEESLCKIGGNAVTTLGPPLSAWYYMNVHVTITIERGRSPRQI